MLKIGYEPQALDILVDAYNENDLYFGKDVPQITYLDINGKERKHYPDIWIPAHNLLVEVKSEYTVKQPNVQEKKIAAIEMGYKYEIWVMNKMGVLLEKH